MLQASCSGFRRFLLGFNVVLQCGLATPAAAIGCLGNPVGFAVCLGIGATLVVGACAAAIDDITSCQ